jgi:hypothetical protein
VIITAVAVKYVESANLELHTCVSSLLTTILSAEMAVKDDVDCST